MTKRKISKAKAKAMNYDYTGKERQQKFRAKQAAAGLVCVRVWIKKALTEELRSFVEKANSK